MSITGDTVRLRVRFRDVNGMGIEPYNVSVSVYSGQREVLDSIVLDDTYKESEGVYFYDYVLPDEEQEFIFEFRGVYEEKPVIARGSFASKFY